MIAAAARGALMLATAVALLSLSVSLAEAPQQTLRVVADLVALCDPGACTNAMECSVVTGVSGGAPKPGIFEHPLPQGESRLPYRLALPALPPGGRLLLVTDLGLRDGAKLDDPQATFNGVRFRVEMDGTRVLDEAVLDFGWRRRAIDVSAYAGRAAGLALITTANGDGNANYDWAMWGGPRVLMVAGDASARPRAAGSAGVVVCSYETVPQATPEGDFVVQGLTADGTVRAEARMSARAASPKAGLVVLDYDFSAEGALQSIRAEAPAGIRIAQATVHEYAPGLRIAALSPTSALVFAQQRAALTAIVVSDSPAPTAAGEYELSWGIASSAEEARRAAQADAARAPVPVVRSGASASMRRELRPRRAGQQYVAALLRGPDGQVSAERTVTVRPTPPRLPSSAPDRAEVAVTRRSILLENQLCRMAVIGNDANQADHARFFVRTGGQWRLVAATDALARLLCRGTDGGEATADVVITQAKGGRVEGGSTLQLTGHIGPPEQPVAALTLDFRLGDGSPRIEAQYTVQVQREAALLQFRGPWLYVGDGAFGAAKRFATFPGLEYLSSDERSSSDRDVATDRADRTTPQPYKVTVPLLAVESDDGLVGLLWRQDQKWDGEHWSLSPRFASPNFLSGQENHLLGLFVPTVPDFLAENADRAAEPLMVEPGDELSIECQMVLMPDGTVLDAVPQWWEAYGFPQPLEPPRSFAEELALSRHGFMVSVWDEETKGFRHCIDWAPGIAPGYCTLLWHDAHLSKDGSRDAVLERIRTHADRILHEEAGQALASPGGCHIMRWEFPFHYGHLQEGLAGAQAQAYGAIASQGEDGGWRFHPPDERHRMLGEDGTAVVGTCAHPAFTILKYARLTGDEKCKEAGRKALAFMDQFTVPRGAQGWECPIMEPDILAAAWAMGAYIEGYRTFGEPQYLDKAVYWAKTGLPFAYSWYQPDRPGMLWATVPVFGSTFMTHLWFGVPVQWCGLVYAYELQHLWVHDQSLPWREIARGITVSGQYQQFGDEEPDKKGTYPDGFYGNCTQRMPPFINPEDIIVNVLALEGYDPDPDTVRLPRPGGAVVVSSGARVSGMKLTDGRLGLRLSYFRGATSHTVVSNVSRPEAVQGAESWSYDAEGERLFVSSAHDAIEQEVSVQFGTR